MNRISNRIILAVVALVLAFTFASCQTAETPISAAAPVTVSPAVTSTTPAAQATSSVVPAVADPVVVKNPTYSFQVYGFDVTAELVAPNTIVLTYPDFITNQEVLDCAAAAYQAFELYLRDSKLVYGKGTATVTLNYDITEAEFTSFAPYVDSALKGYVDFVLEEMDKAESAQAAADAAKLATAKAAEAAKAAADKAAAEAAEKAAAEKATTEKAATETKTADNKATTAATKAAAESAAAEPTPKKSAAGIVILIIVICLAAAGAVYYFLVLKKKK